MGEEGGTGRVEHVDRVMGRWSKSFVRVGSTMPAHQAIAKKSRNNTIHRANRDTKVLTIVRYSKCYWLSIENNLIFANQKAFFHHAYPRSL